MTASQVYYLNQNYDSWLSKYEPKLKEIEIGMQTESLTVQQQMTALEDLQSIYRSYFENIQPLADNTKWRRILNRPEEQRAVDSLTRIQDKVFSKDLFEFYKETLESQSTLPDYDWANEVEYLQPDELRSKLKMLKLKYTFTKIRDMNRNAFEKVVHLVTETIGISSDTFPLRAGKLFNRPEVIEDISQTLQPMDLLLDRANRFKMSHMIIPGYYGHGGIYLGTKAQLIKAGLWNHPAVVPYHAAIENGQVMLEAKRTGVKLRTLKEYSNTDSITALRQRDLSTEQLTEIMQRGLRQLGKKFDHTFTLEHSESFFCTKLIYFAFDHIPWKSTKTLGRTSLPPDFIAALSMGDNRYFDPVLAYDYGQKVTGDLQQYIERVQRQVP